MLRLQRRSQHELFKRYHPSQVSSPSSTVLSIVTDNTSYKVGDTISITVDNGSGAAANAVGLYRQGDDASVAQPVDWKYLANNSQVLPGVGVTGGTVTINTTSLISGNYFVALTATLMRQRLSPPQIRLRLRLRKAELLLSLQMVSFSMD